MGYKLYYTTCVCTYVYVGTRWWAKIVYYTEIMYVGRLDW